MLRSFVGRQWPAPDKSEFLTPGPLGPVSDKETVLKAESLCSYQVSLFGIGARPQDSAMQDDVRCGPEPRPDPQAPRQPGRELSPMRSLRASSWGNGTRRCSRSFGILGPPFGHKKITNSLGQRSGGVIQSGRDS